MTKNIFDPLRGTCINHGCNKPQMRYGSNADGTNKYKTICRNCYGAKNPNDKAKYARGVTPFKTGICANHDGHLGFPCNYNPNDVPKGVPLVTHIDHIDGNHQNNDPGNIQELDPICHQIKTHQNKDNHKGRAANKKIIDKAEARFGELFEV